jgi:immune inhibitor A
MSKSKWLVLISLLLIFLCICLLGLCAAGSGAMLYFSKQAQINPDLEQEGQVYQDSQENTVPPTLTKKPDLPQQTTPTHEIAFEATVVPAELEQVPAELGEAFETLRRIENEVVPDNNLNDLAFRLEGITNVPASVDLPIEIMILGRQELFWVMDTETNQHFRVAATLQYITEHTYFWVDDSSYFDAPALEKLALAFEEKIYPTNRAFFGSEWTPGIDNDPHLYILLAQGIGSRVAGYFSSNDSVHPTIREYSNAHELFLINSDQSLEAEYTYGVLAHEFQHMIHWYHDRNESTWLNEGFSELAVFLNGYGVGSKDYRYTMEPDIQLNDWPNDSNIATPHYGAAFLFVTYFLDRFGEEATQALVGHPDNSMRSVDKVLAELDYEDVFSGNQLGADDVFADWTVANYLQNETIGDGRYSYNNYPGAPQAYESEWYTNCPSSTDQNESIERTVQQYGVDYIGIACQGEYLLEFSGNREVGVLPMDAYSGIYAFWSNKGDESDMTLTREFDFREQESPLTLSFRTWHDLEEDYDYLYLLASEDGQHWEILDTPSGTDNNPSGNSYGWGYNGVTDGWILEEVDISEYAGKQILLRFEYITDAAVNGEGFLLDDVSIPEIKYYTDFEENGGGWEAAGWVRIQNSLPQTYKLSIIRNGVSPQVEIIPLDEKQKAVVPLVLGTEFSDIVLVVSGTTRYTRQPARYTFGLKKAD